MREEEQKHKGQRKREMLGAGLALRELQRDLKDGARGSQLETLSCSSMRQKERVELLFAFSGCCLSGQKCTANYTFLLQSSGGLYLGGTLGNGHQRPRDKYLERKEKLNFGLQKEKKRMRKIMKVSKLTIIHFWQKNRFQAPFSYSRGTRRSFRQQYGKNQKFSSFYQGVQVYSSFYYLKGHHQI